MRKYSFIPIMKLLPYFLKNVENNLKYELLKYAS